MSPLSKHHRKNRLPPIIWVLATLFTGAIAINIAMVLIAVNHHSELVRPDYYQHAMRQDSISGDYARPDSLGLNIGLLKSGFRWLVVIKTADSSLIQKKGIKGGIHFYRSSDRKQDQYHPLSPLPDTHILATPDVSLEKGPWKAKIRLAWGPWILRKSFDLYE